MVVSGPAFRFLHEWGECALNLAFPWPESDAAEPVSIEPPFCAQCCEPFPAHPQPVGAFLCSNCRDTRWHLAWARAGYRTEGQVLEAIVGFKYREESYQLGPLVGWLHEAYQRFASDTSWDALVPVPLHHRRHRERGFNQATELAQGLARKEGLRIFNCLYRYRETISQATLERSTRRENMLGAFKLKPEFDVREKCLLLIDDVFTTGATANACAHALAQAGAGTVAVLTVARS